MRLVRLGKGLEDLGKPKVRLGKGLEGLGKPKVRLGKRLEEPITHLSKRVEGLGRAKVSLGKVLEDLVKSKVRPNGGSQAQSASWKGSQPDKSGSWQEIEGSRQAKGVSRKAIVGYWQVQS